MRIMAVGTLLLALGVLALTSGASSQTAFAEGAVAEDGTISLPANFRTDYVLLGAWSVAGDADTGGEIGLHIVYAPKAAVAGYRETGRFPDGTLLVKELFNGTTQSLTTGEATRAADKVGTFVMVKDDQGRFPDSTLWGDGWGWSFFAGAETKTAVTKDYAAECLGCHEPARATDLVYVEAYPVLKD